MTTPEKDSPAIQFLINWLDSNWENFSKTADWSQAPELIQLLLGIFAIFLTPPVFNKITVYRRKFFVEVAQWTKKRDKYQLFRVIVNNKSERIISCELQILLKSTTKYGQIYEINYSGDKIESHIFEITGSLIKLKIMNPKSSFVFEGVSDIGKIEIYHNNKKMAYNVLNISAGHNFSQSNLNIMHQRLMLLMLQFILLGVIIVVFLLKIGIFDA